MQINRNPLFMKEENGYVCCDLCHNNCKIESGKFGLCRVRGNKAGESIIPFYGFVSAIAIDPIEKKPLYHFKPGSRIFSLGFAGCNLYCPFCQNWRISQSIDINALSTMGKWMLPEKIISAAITHNSPSIAYTYSEPLIHIEFILDCMRLAHKHGIANVLVTNGCIKEKAAAEILKYTDAANVDLKCFSQETYKKILGGDLQTVLDFITLCYKMNVHLEVTTLVVPNLNDSKDELNAAADFIAGLDREIPWHLTAYHPDYRWDTPRTNPGFLLTTAKEMEKKLRYVHTGNI